MQSIPPVEAAFVAVEGVRLHYLRAGAGPPLLLIHGLVGSSRNWRHSIGPLSQMATVYAIDQLNMGRSQRAASVDASLEATADRLAVTMDAFGLEAADIAGHSHGGAVAMMFAARHPGRVRRLILFAPANPFSHPGDRLVRTFSTPPGRLVARALPHLPGRIQRIGLARVCGDPTRVPTGSLEAYTEGLAIPGTMQHIMAIVRTWFADMAKLKAVLPSITDIPTLLLWGDRDCAVDPASAAPLQRALRNSEMHIIPGGGHILFEEFPRKLNRIMLDWLQNDSSLVAAANPLVPGELERFGAFQPEYLPEPQQDLHLHQVQLRTR